MTSWSCRAGYRPQCKRGHLFPRCGRRHGNPHGSTPRQPSAKMRRLR